MGHEDGGSGLLQDPLRVDASAGRAAGRAPSVGPSDGFPGGSGHGSQGRFVCREGAGGALVYGRNVEKSQWVGSDKDREKRLDELFGGAAKGYKEALELIEALGKETARKLAQLLKNPEVKSTKGDGLANAKQRLELARRRWDYVASKLDLADPVRATSLRAEVARLLSGARRSPRPTSNRSWRSSTRTSKRPRRRSRKASLRIRSRDASVSQPIDFPGFARRLYDLRLRLYQIVPDAPLVKKISNTLAPFYPGDTRTSFKPTAYSSLVESKKAEALKSVKALIEDAEKLVDNTLTDARELVASREGPSRLGEILAEAKLYKDRLRELASPERQPRVDFRPVERLEKMLNAAIASARSFREDEATAGLVRVAEGIRIADAWTVARRHSDTPIPNAMEKQSSKGAPRAPRPPIERVMAHKEVTDALAKSFEVWHQNYSAQLMNLSGERPGFKPNVSAKALTEATKRFPDRYNFASEMYKQIIHKLTNQKLKPEEADAAVKKSLELIKPLILEMRDDFRLLRGAISGDPTEVEAKSGAKPAKAPEPRPYVPTADWKADVVNHRVAYADAEVQRIGSSQYTADLLKPRDESAPPLVLKHRGNNVDAGCSGPRPTTTRRPATTRTSPSASANLEAGGKKGLRRWRPWKVRAPSRSRTTSRSGSIAARFRTKTTGASFNSLSRGPSASSPTSTSAASSTPISSPTTSCSTLPPGT